MDIVVEAAVIAVTCVGIVVCAIGVIAYAIEAWDD